MRSLDDIYEAIEEINNSTMFCLFVDTEPMTFEEAVKDERWRLAMDEEMKAIERNNTWQLATLLKGK